MENRTLNKIGNFDTIRDVLADPDNQAAIDSNEGFKDESEEFRHLRTIMQPFVQLAGGDTKGATLNKDRLRKALLKRLEKVTAGGWAYAQKVGDAQLESDMNYTKSDLKMRGGVLETEAQEVHDKLAAVVASDAAASPAPVTPISKYKVTAQTLSDLQDATDALLLVEKGPKVLGDKISSAGDRVLAMVDALDAKKEVLRRLLPQLEDDFATFVSAMRKAMVIVDTAATHAAPKKATTEPGGAKPA